MSYITKYMKWDQSQSRWSGICPRCNHQTFFELKNTVGGNPNIAETIYCPSKHAVFIEYRAGDPLKKIVSCSPVDYSVNIPIWLPEIYKNVYRELLELRSVGSKRGVIALCAILLEAHVNELIKNPGEKKKSLFQRLEILKRKGLIDTDQFSQATITRLTRNDVLHPDEILAEVKDEDAESVFEETSGFFERSYRWRSSKALASPKKDTKEIAEETQLLSEG